MKVTSLNSIVKINEIVREANHTQANHGYSNGVLHYSGSLAAEMIVVI
jgi:hypothetical protein